MGKYNEYINRDVEVVVKPGADGEEEEDDSLDMEDEEDNLDEEGDLDEVGDLDEDYPADAGIEDDAGPEEEPAYPGNYDEYEEGDAEYEALEMDAVAKVHQILIIIGIQKVCSTLKCKKKMFSF